MAKNLKKLKSNRPLTGAEYRKSATKEADVQSAVVGFLQLRGWLVMITDAAMTVIGEERRRSSLDAGTPDVVAVRRAPLGEQVLLIEAKRPEGGHIRDSQVLWHAYASKFGFEVWIVRNFDEFETRYFTNYH